MTPKLFLTDIDGTLLRGTTTIPPSVLQAAQAFMDAGGLLSLSTGRSTISAIPIAKQLNVNFLCVFYGGSMIYDPLYNKCKHMKTFSSAINDVISYIYSTFTGLSLQIYTANHIYVLRRNARLQARGIASENVGPIEAIDAVEGGILKIVCASDDVEQLQLCLDYLPNNICCGAFASRSFIDITPHGSGKADAMQYISEYYGIPYSDFFSAGDSMNDLPMLKLSGKSYAPSNAIEEVKQSVSLCVPPAEEGGMAEAFMDAITFL